ncbi:MAG: endonuclease MutS2 [Candidatus Aphodosoma sp.]
MLYPVNFEHKIGFDSVRSLIDEKCAGSWGVEEAEKISFSNDFDTIVASLTLINEMMSLITDSNALPVPVVIDLRQQFADTKAEGTFLETKDLIALKKNISTLRELVQFISDADPNRFPSLINFVKDTFTFANIENRIDSIINRFGDVKDNASPNLAQIRRDIIISQNSVSKIMRSVLNKAAEDGLIDKDVTPSLREGRLVIPVSSMNKRRIPGIVHDESATGKTVFIEPTAVVEVNNRIRELENEERREIIRILTEFTNFVRPFYDDILNSCLLVAKIDAIRAKALFSIDIKAIKPYLYSDCRIDWYEARHPLLEKSLTRQGKKIQPLNIRLNKKQRILLISGPNAGGKSVCLKTAGLLQYMLQCGLPIPIHERSNAGIFQSIFIDIGDEQSIENDLSTYSSHLINMKNCIKYSNGKSLLLIDEFGTGTEPQLGGAIAEAVLNRLNTNHVYGIITTHYTNLKHYAAQTEGIVNAAMLYDRNKMQPLFMLSIGTAGSSFAIEIARKIGLPDDVINAASKIVGEEQIDFDKHLQDVARDKRYWEQKRAKIKEEEKKLQSLTEHYDALVQDIKKKEKEIIRNAKEEASQIIKNSNAKIENTIRAIKESAADKNITQSERRELENFKKSLDKQLEKQPSVKQQQDFHKGERVRIKGQNIAGTIDAVNGKTAIVFFGQIKSTVDVSKLEHLTASQLKEMEKYSANSVAASKKGFDMRERQLNFSQDIDVRGMRVDEALQAVIYFLDDAQMFNVSRVRILHGTGTGALKSAIRDYLYQSSIVKSFKDEHVQFGGAGITVVDLA